MPRCASQQKLATDGRDGSKLGRAGDVRCTTVLPPKADVHPRSCYVAKVPEPDGGSPLYTRALSRWAAIGKASSVSFVYFPRPFLVSVTRAARAASLACDTGPAN